MKLLEVHRLRQVGVEAGRAGARLVLLLPIARDGDHPGSRKQLILPQSRDNLVARHARAAQIAQNDLQQNSGAMDRRIGPIGGFDLTTGQFQEFSEAVSRVTIVFHNQNPA